MERRSHDWKFGWRLALAPTRALFDSKFMKRQEGWNIKRWSRTFLVLNGVLLFSLKPLSLATYWTEGVLIVSALYVIPFSRVMEIFYAFYYDALEKLNEGGSKSSSLTRGDRFRLVGLSYAEVCICFATFYHAMPVSWFNLPEKGFHAGRFISCFDWLYFSWVTITTTGYGDFSPSNPVARAFVMAELAMGLVLIVFAVGSYFAYRDDVDQPAQ